jgi:hypothetical protein
MQVTFMKYSDSYKEKATKNSNAFEWHKLYEESWHAEITNEDNVHHFIRYQV